MGENNMTEDDEGNLVIPIKVKKISVKKYDITHLSQIKTITFYLFKPLLQTNGIC